MMEAFVAALATFTSGIGAGLLVARYARRADNIDTTRRVAVQTAWAILAFFASAAFHAIVGHWSLTWCWGVIGAVLLAYDIWTARTPGRRVE